MLIFTLKNTAGNNRVQILNSTLQHEMSVVSDGGDSPFDRPNDVCIDHNGMIIIADTFRNALHWFTQVKIKGIRK